MKQTDLVPPLWSNTQQLSSPLKYISPKHPVFLISNFLLLSDN